MDNTKRTPLKLKHPVKFGEETVTVLEFRRIKGKELRRLPANPTTDDMLKLAGALCGQPDSFIDEVDAEDIFAITELVEGFFPDGPTTGKTP